MTVTEKLICRLILLLSIKSSVIVYALYLPNIRLTVELKLMAISNESFLVTLLYVEIFNGTTYCAYFRRNAKGFT